MVSNGFKCPLMIDLEFNVVNYITVNRTLYAAIAQTSFGQRHFLLKSGRDCAGPIYTGQGS